MCSATYTRARARRRAPLGITIFRESFFSHATRSLCIMESALKSSWMASLSLSLSPRPTVPAPLTHTHTRVWCLERERKDTRSRLVAAAAFGFFSGRRQPAVILFLSFATHTRESVRVSTHVTHRHKLLPTIINACAALLSLSLSFTRWISSETKQSASCCCCAVIYYRF